MKSDTTRQLTEADIINAMKKIQTNAAETVLQEAGIDIVDVLDQAEEDLARPGRLKGFPPVTVVEWAPLSLRIDPIVGPWSPERMAQDEARYEVEGSPIRVIGSGTKIDRLTTRGPATAPTPSGPAVSPPIETQPVPQVETAPSPEPAAPSVGTGEEVASAASSIRTEDLDITKEEREYLESRGIDPAQLAADMIENELTVEQVAGMIQLKRAEADPAKPYLIERKKGGIVIEHYHVQKHRPAGKIMTIRRHPSGKVEELHPTKGWRKKSGGR